MNSPIAHSLIGKEIPGKRPHAGTNHVSYCFLTILSDDNYILAGRENHVSYCFLHILSDDSYISAGRENQVSYCFLHTLSDDNYILTGRERKYNRQVRLPNTNARLETGSQTLETHEL